MNNIPKGTTHVWTPAVYKAYVGFGVHRRAYYKRSHHKWRVWSQLTQQWLWSNNAPEWFTIERNEGYFVTIKRFNSPGFIAKEERV